MDEQPIVEQTTIVGDFDSDLDSVATEPATTLTEPAATETPTEAPVAEAPTADATPATPNEDAIRIKAAAEALGIPEETFRAEVERQRVEMAKIAETEKAEAATQTLLERLQPEANSILSRTRLDIGEDDYLSPAAAEALWAKTWEAEQLKELLAAKDSEIAGVSAEKSVERVVAEFPGVDVEVLRDMASRGKDLGELQKFAKRQADREASIAQNAIAKYAATKDAAAKSTTGPNKALAQTGARMGRVSLDEAME